MPTALVQGRISTEHTERLRGLVGPDWTVLEWDPRKQGPEEFESWRCKQMSLSAARFPWTAGRPCRN